MNLPHDGVALKDSPQAREKLIGDGSLAADLRFRGDLNNPSPDATLHRYDDQRFGLKNGLTCINAR